MTNSIIESQSTRFNGIYQGNALVKSQLKQDGPEHCWVLEESNVEHRKIFQYLIIVVVKNISLISNQNLPSSNLHPLPLLFSSTLYANPLHLLCRCPLKWHSVSDMTLGHSMLEVVNQTCSGPFSAAEVICYEMLDLHTIIYIFGTQNTVIKNHTLKKYLLTVPGNHLCLFRLACGSVSKLWGKKIYQINNMDHQF